MMMVALISGQQCTMQQEFEQGNDGNKIKVGRSPTRDVHSVFMIRACDRCKLCISLSGLCVKVKVANSENFRLSALISTIN